MRSSERTSGRPSVLHPIHGRVTSLVNQIRLRARSFPVAERVRPAPQLRKSAFCIKIFRRNHLVRTLCKHNRTLTHNSLTRDRCRRVSPSTRTFGMASPKLAGIHRPPPSAVNLGGRECDNTRQMSGFFFSLARMAQRAISAYKYF